MKLELHSDAARWIGTTLAWLLAFSILTLWIVERWAVSIVQVGIFLMAAIWLAGVVVHKYPVRLSWLFLPLTGAVVWGCAQLAVGGTIYRWATGNAVLDWGARLAVFFVALQVYDDEATRRRVLRALLWFGFGLSVAASLQRFLTPGKVFGMFETGLSGGVMGPFPYHNQYAAFVETIVPLAVLGAVEERTGKLLYVVMAGAMIASVVASTSRAGTLAVMAETVAVLCLVRMRRKLPWRRVGLVLGGTALFVVVFGATVGWGTLWEKLLRADPYAQRRELLYSSLRMAEDRPWMGFGLGTWSTAYPSYADFDDGLFDNQAHNDWVQWAAEGGTPFFLLMLLLAGMLLRPAIRTMWGVGLLAVFLHCLVDYHFQQRPGFGYYFFALTAIMVRSGRTRREPSSGKMWKSIHYEQASRE